MGILILIVNILVGVAFLTLLERKVLGYIQLRKGPNKVGVGGILQPFRDAIKLFTKELFILNKSNYFVYYLCPVLVFFFIIIIWTLRPFFTNFYYINYSVLILFLILRLISYVYMLIGWSSNSSYSMLGSIRVVAQTLSYEVSLIIIVLIILILVESYSLKDFEYWQNMGGWFIFIVRPLFLTFFLRILAEINRSPIDFIEGESELVSGFNIEYFRGRFALIFMAEYGMIIFFSYLSSLMFTNLMGSLYIYIYIGLMMRVIIFIRGLLPRMRYDELMYMCWKIILPFVICIIVWIIGVKFFFIALI